MALALRAEVREFILEEERDLSEDKRTIFLIKPITGLEYCTVRDVAVIDRASLSSEEGFALPININRIQYETVKAGLDGWENFKFDDGKPCEYTDNKSDNVAKIPPQYWLELYLAIQELSEVDGATVKNSNSPPSGSQ